MHAFFGTMDERRGTADTEQDKWARAYQEEIELPRELAEGMRELALAARTQDELSHRWTKCEQLRLLLRPVDNPHDPGKARVTHDDIDLEDVELPDSF